MLSLSSVSRPHFYYYHEFDDMVLVVLDTSRLMWNKEAKEQENMLKQAHAKAQGKFFVVVAHHPYLSNGQHGNAGGYEDIPILPSFVSGKFVKRFVDRHVCGRAHLYISGHDHNMQLIDGRIRNCNTIFAVSGAGASTTKLKRRNPALYQSEELGFLALTATKDALTLRFYDAENRQNYVETIQK
jgi:tartrate-resistant acid phosphatase type 5